MSSATHVRAPIFEKVHSTNSCWAIFTKNKIKLITLRNNILDAISDCSLELSDKINFAEKKEF